MRRKPPEQLNVPMSSMIDIVFLLLIYFIVTARDEVSEAHLAVNLPAPGVAKASENRPQMMEIEVHPGYLSVRGMRLPIQEVANTLMRLGKNDPDITVLVKVNLSARAEDLVTALDLCSAANLNNLNVVTLK
jgi:biopolymer transport protein ExbD